MKKNKIIIFFTFGFLILLFMLIGYGFITEGKAEKPLNISVILYGNDMERWTSLKQGAEQAEKELNILINFVTTSDENLPEEQIELIEREVANGADGLLIASCNSKELEETVAELVQELPIIMIETGVNNVETEQYLSADNYKMGEALAESLMKEGLSQNNIAIISNNLQRDSITNRYSGFVETIKAHKVFSFNNLENTPENERYIKRFLSDNKIDTIVAFDNQSLEDLIDFIELSKLEVLVYGIGNTDKVVYYLDKGIIQTIVFQNEFSVGYLGTELLSRKITNISTGKIPKIAFQVINKDVMYTKENQRLLFPLVQ